MPKKKETGKSDEQDFSSQVEKPGPEPETESEDPELKSTSENSKKEASEKKTGDAPRKKLYLRLALFASLAVVMGLLASALFFFGERAGAPLTGEETASLTLPPGEFHVINRGEEEKGEISKPVFEVPPSDQALDKTPDPESEQDKAPAEYPGKAAIIIDDLGCDMRMAKKIFELDARVTFSVLPYCRFTEDIIEMAGQKGFEIMLHLPMEPNEFPRFNPGPGSLLAYMEPEAITEALLANLDATPGIKGVNNHMGSKMTASSSSMDLIFSTLKERGLFFIDSRTTAKSKCRSSAIKANIKFGERDVFIDHVQSSEFIRKQLKLLVKIAIRRGSAIGIAHPHELTISILKEEIPLMKRKIKLVYASELTHYGNGLFEK